MHHQRVPREASKTASLATNGVLNKLVSIQIHHLSSHFLYAHAFGGTLVLHIGCTHHIFMIFFFMSKFLCLSSYVVLSSFRTIFVLSFCLSFFSFYLLFFLVFIIMLRLLQITYIHTTYNKLCSMCCTVLCVWNGYSLSAPWNIYDSCTKSGCWSNLRIVPTYTIYFQIPIPGLSSSWEFVSWLSAYDYVWNPFVYHIPDGNASNLIRLWHRRAKARKANVLESFPPSSRLIIKVDKAWKHDTWCTPEAWHSNWLD